MSKALSEDQVLNKLVRSLSSGEYLFRQGDMGNTMFLILDGTVHLFHRTAQSERLVWTLGPGEMIGEKAILSQTPYHRTVTAQAKTLVSVIEFDANNLKTIQSRFTDFNTRMIKMLSERLDQANELISILQSKNDVDRVVQYLLFYSSMHANKTPQGLEIAITQEELANSVNCPQELVTTLLEQLTKENLLQKKSNSYIIVDAQLLEENINALKKKIAA